MTKDEARALIYGMPQSEWKAKYQTEATPEQLRRMDESVAKNRVDHAGNGDLDQALEQSFPASDPPEMTQRSEEHTSELQSLMRISYAVFCLKKKKTRNTQIKYYSPKLSKHCNKHNTSHAHRKHYNNRCPILNVRNNDDYILHSYHYQRHQKRTLDNQ